VTDLIANPQNFALVGGKRTPGPVCELTGAALKRQWDKQKPSGSSGGRLVFKGRDFSEFTMRLMLLTSDDFAAWDVFKQILEQPPRLDAAGRRVLSGLDFAHPQTEDVGIRAVVLGERPQLVQGNTGDYTVDIKFIEYRDPEPVHARARGSRNSDDPVDREIDALRRQGDALATQIETRERAAE
jgi:hypothetical protein